MKKLIVSLLHLLWRLGKSTLSIPERRRLASAMLRLLLRQYLARGQSPGDMPSEDFLGYSISSFDYATLTGLLDEIFVERVYEFKTTSRAPLILDCGGNIGLSVLYFKHRFPDARVICFEPDRAAFAKLLENVSVNNLNGVEAHPCAVLDVQGPVSFYSDQDNLNRVGMSVTRRLEDKGMRLDETRVEAVYLSSYFAETVDFLKLDVEGAELRVLRELAGKQKLGLIQQMVIEYHYDLSNRDNSLGELLRLLEHSGFRYLVHSPFRSPFHAHADQPYSFLLYAYHAAAGRG